MNLVTVRLLAVAGALVWFGAVLLLSGVPRLSRPSLADRLRPYAPGGHAEVLARRSSGRVLSAVMLPLLVDVAGRLAAAFGAKESAARRLARIHSPTDAGTFRLRQMALSGAGLLVGTLAAVVLHPSPVVDLLLVLSPALAAFLAVEQRLARRSERWQLSLMLEVPVVSEQLAMLLNAGYSLGSALSRLVGRSGGCVARDLVLVVNRIQQGLGIAEALQEWSERAGVPAVERLVAVLSLHAGGPDLGRLVSNEASTSRAEMHRRTVEMIEKRSQQVWIPVTVATLVPGTLLLAVPFTAALRLFAGT